MRTASEMVEFASNGVKLSKAMVKGFSVVEDSLNSGENVLFSAGAFVENNSSCPVGLAITENRVVIGQKTMFSSNVISISLDKINDVSIKCKFTGDYITISNICDNIVVSTFKKKGSEIVSAIHSTIDNLKKSSEESGSAADEILKYKNLADNGIITQEEFETKKKQLLGL